MGKTDLGDGYTRWDWHVHYPINSYNVSLNIGELRAVQPIGLAICRSISTCCPASLEKAKKQFAQAKPMIEAFQKVFGEYPFRRTATS